MKKLLSVVADVVTIAAVVGHTGYIARAHYRQKKAVAFAAELERRSEKLKESAADRILPLEFQLAPALDEAVQLLRQHMDLGEDINLNGVREQLCSLISYEIAAPERNRLREWATSLEAKWPLTVHVEVEDESYMQELRAEYENIGVEVDKLVDQAKTVFQPTP